MGRPKTYTESTCVAITSGTAKTRLNRNSERRAIVNAIIDNDGVMTIGELNEHFGFDTTDYVRALIKAEWLHIVERGEQ